MIAPKGVHGYLEEVTAVGLLKAYVRDSIKLAIGVTPGTVSSKVLMDIQEAIIQECPKARKCPAPPGQLENLLQAHLEKASSSKHGEEQASRSRYGSHSANRRMNSYSL